MTTTDTTAALEAAIDAYAQAAIANRRATSASPDERVALTAAWAAIAPAITAHVDAEIARRLACAPGVEEAMDVVADLYAAGGRGILDAEEIRLRDGSIPALRAAIAADKARAVAESRPTPSAPKSGYYTYAVRVVITDGITLTRETDVSGLWSPELESFAGRMLIDLARPITDAERAAPPVARWARPTPDEARRLVDDFAEAVGDWTASGDASGVGLTRDALLRALGV